MNRKTVITLAAAILTSICPLMYGADSAPKYQQVAKWQIGGEGGWDYLAFDGVGNRLFIAHSDQISVVDANSGKQVGEVPAKHAHGITFVQDKNLGFSSNGGAGTVTVFDLKTLKPIQDIKVGQNPDAIIYDTHTKRVIVMNGKSEDVSVIDPDSLKVVTTVPVGGKLEFAATDPTHIYVNVEDKGEIAVIDSKNWKVANRWKLADCEEPSGLALDAKTGHLFTVCGNKKMLVLDSKNGQLVSTVPTGAGTDAAAFDANLDLAFSSNGEGTLTLVKPEGRGYAVAQNVQTQKGARTMALDPKTHRIYLVTAEFGPPAAGQKRPSIKPGTFTVLVYAPQQ